MTLTLLRPRPFKEEGGATRFAAAGKKRTKEMSTEARVPDSSVLDDSLEESGASPIIPIIKYSPIRLTPAAAACNISLSYEEDIQKNDTITKTHKKDIVTESPVSSPPPSFSPKLKIVPCFGKKGKGTTTSAKKRPPLKAKSPPPPPPPSCSSSQEETSNGVKSLSVQSDNMSAREGSPSQPVKPGDDASVEARAPPTIPAISEVSEETDSTAKVGKGRKKMAESKEKGVSLKIKDTKNANKTGKVAKKVEKITKEVEKDGAAGRNKNSATSKKKGAQKAKKISGTDKATEEKTLKVTENPLQEMNNEEQNEEEKERAKRELEEFLKEEEKLDQKIQAERKRLSQTNNSIKSKTSKKCTVSTKTESIISTSPDQLNTTPPFYMTQSQPSSESYSSEEFLPSPESKQNDESTSPPSNKEKENDGIWVQCDNPDCFKWRFLINVKDPMDLPDKWYCDMNKDSKYNSCIIEEEKWSSLDTDEVYVYSPYTPGSLLLAKLEGYPWWPGIIEADPDTDAYYEAKNEKGGKPSPATPEKYHVVFIDTPVSRSWIHALNTAPFTCSTTLKDCGSNIPLKYQAGLFTAMSQAKSALSLPLNERLSQWGFMSRYNKGRKRKGSSNQGGKPSKRSTAKLSKKNDEIAP